MKVIAVIFAVISLILELFATYLFFFKDSIAISFLIHTLSCTTISLTLGAYIQRKLGKFLQGFVLSSITSLLIPVAGTVFLLMGFLFFLKEARGKIHLPARTIDTDEILYEFTRIKPRKLGEGALKFFTNFRKKEELLLFLKDILIPFSVEAARNFLKERNDEVRLGAFSILVKLEKEINNRISTLKEIFDSEKDPYKRALLSREIASYYWELLYFNLVDRELEEFVINEALRYVEEAIKELKDSYTAFIAGRMFLKQKDFERARKFLLSAYETGDKLDRIRVIPYLAEVEYHFGNFKRVKELFEELPYSIHPNVQFAKIFWSGRKSWKT